MICFAVKLFFHFLPSLLLVFETKHYLIMDVMVTTKVHLVCYNYGSFTLRAEPSQTQPD